MPEVCPRFCQKKNQEQPLYNDELCSSTGRTGATVDGFATCKHSSSITLQWASHHGAWGMGWWLGPHLMHYDTTAGSKSFLTIAVMVRHSLGRFPHKYCYILLALLHCERPCSGHSNRSSFALLVVEAGHIYSTSFVIYFVIYITSV